MSRSTQMKALVVAAIATCHWATSASAQVVDRSTLTGKILPGYQGWFYCPGDGNDPIVGWRHWSKSTTTIGPNLYSTDLWPEVSEYAPGDVFNAPGVNLIDGIFTGNLFSSIRQGVQNKHFQWMQQYGIDGVFVQRFLSELGDPTFFAARNTVLTNVRNAANSYGRTFSVEYDISGANEATLYTDLTNDWIYLSNTYNIRNDPRYQYHNGKPVITIWGLGFSDRPGTPTIANQIINFFKNDPTYGNCYCIGGVPATWRTLAAPSKTDPAWNATYRSWHCINPWTVGAYRTSTDITNWKNNVASPDVTLCNSLGIKYLPVIWPGFSWDNLMNLPPGTSNFDRRNGQHYWDQAYAYESLSGVSTMFVAMFDECDEGTAIFKISDDTPNTNHWITNFGYPPNWWMRLAGSSGQMIRGEIGLSGTIPINPRTTYSGDVSIDMGSPDVADLMTNPQIGDGTTTPATIGGRTCRKNTTAGVDYYFYFTVDDSFAYQGSANDIYIKMDYYDTGGGTMTLVYDAPTSPYKGGPSVTVGNTNTWKTTTFHITDAYFNNRENGGSDFRIYLGGSITRYIDIVRVSEKGPVSIFTATPSSGTAPLAVAFNATASYDPNGTISSYAWVFGDGGTGSGSTINHTYNSGGNFNAQLTTTDNSGNTDIAIVPISVSGSAPQAPYGGTPWAIPGTIQAENYDTGGEGVAYHDISAGNTGGQYRSDNVDIETTSDTGGGYNVGWIDVGEWLEYTVNVTNTGDHAFALRLASGGSGTVTLKMNGNTIASAKPFAATGGWQNWTSVTIPGIFLTAGNNQILQVLFDTGNLNMNKVDVTFNGADVVSVDLASSDINDGMNRVVVGDGNTTATSIGGHNCRQNTNPASDFYMYYAVTDGYAFQGNKNSAEITFDYYDNGTGVLQLTYDGTGNMWTNGPSITRTNTNTWKTTTFHINDAYFGNRENGGADFRFAAPVGNTFYMDTVTVFATGFANKGFEGGFSAAGGGFNGSVGTGWTPYVYGGVPSNFTFSDETGSGNFDTGAHSQKVVSAAGKEGGVYNQINTVPGQTYTITVRVKSGSPAAWCFFGINTSGGTNPLESSGTIYPANNNRSTSWTTFTWTGAATGNKITLFLDTYDGVGYWDTSTP